MIFVGLGIKVGRVGDHQSWLSDIGVGGSRCVKLGAKDRLRWRWSPKCSLELVVVDGCQSWLHRWSSELVTEGDHWSWLSKVIVTEIGYQR